MATAELSCFGVDQPRHGAGGSAEHGTLDNRVVQRAALRSSWELAAVLHFVDVFRTQLAFADELRAEALEDALLTAGSTPPLLH